MHQNAIMTQIVPEIRQNIRIKPFKVINEEVVFSYEFQNSFELLLGLMNEKMEAYRQAVKEIDTAIVYINKELKD